jgi:coatomer subunit gamma
MKQITGFMSEISDEFKVIIVDAIRSLCIKFPTKHVSMLAFLSGVLRDEGGYDFKRAVIEAMCDMIKFISDCKEQALSHLCEIANSRSYPCGYYTSLASKVPKLRN